MNDPAIDQEEAEPRFLLIGAGAEPARADAVAAVLVALTPAGLIVRGDSDGGWSEVARDHGVALLVEDEVDLAFGADGIHLSDPGQVAEVRAALDRKRGDRLILGADVGLSRHAAMVAGEEGADYVAFGERSRSADDEVVQLIEWWRGLSILPCLGYAADAEAVTRLARIGTDFIGVGSAIWDHPEGPDAAALEMRAAIEKN